ncbi:hypothetical protein [Variovorax boronicumulans]|uniref:hypothetical protein n=1 Tax=Variovorax boronicumulans TaxID=436515 RepID=UPI001C56E83E
MAANMAQFGKYLPIDAPDSGAKDIPDGFPFDEIERCTNIRTRLNDQTHFKRRICGFSYRNSGLRGKQAGTDHAPVRMPRFS